MAEIEEVGGQIITKFRYTDIFSRGERKKLIKILKSKDAKSLKEFMKAKSEDFDKMGFEYGDFLYKTMARSKEKIAKDLEKTI